MCKLFSTFARMKLSVKTIPPSGKTHSGTIIFFHGSGEYALDHTSITLDCFFFFILVHSENTRKIAEMHCFAKNNSIYVTHVIFILFVGDTGSNLVEWIRFLLGKDMQFPYIKVIIPTAPVQPYTPLNGEVIMHATCFSSSNFIYRIYKFVVSLV